MNGALLKVIAQVGPQAVDAVAQGVRAGQARRQLELADKQMKTIMDNREAVTNPFADVTNPYRNMGVATQAAEMQAQQTDQALANTLDTLRATGTSAGGATALARAAAQSKQGVAASIETQEAKNQQLIAAGEQQMQIYQGQGENIRAQRQEGRDDEQIYYQERLSDRAYNQMVDRQSLMRNSISGVTGKLQSELGPMFDAAQGLGFGANGTRNNNGFTPFSNSIYDLNLTNTSNTDPTDFTGINQITDDGSGNILMSPIQSGSSTGSITSGGLGLGSGLAGSGGSNLTWPY